MKTSKHYGDVFSPKAFPNNVRCKRVGENRATEKVTSHHNLLKQMDKGLVERAGFRKPDFACPALLMVLFARLSNSRLVPASNRDFWQGTGNSASFGEQEIAGPWLKPAVCVAAPNSATDLRTGPA